MARERPGHTLQTTALVNEAYLRLVDAGNVNFQNRAHFFAVSAQVMRRILVEFTRRQGSRKRGGEVQRVSLEESLVVYGERGADLVALDDALQALAAIDALGPAAADALPALAKLLHENPPDPRAPYVIARIGPEGLPLLRQALTNENRVVRVEARVCLEMFNSRSEVLFPRDAMDVASFDRRICEFNLRMVNAGFQEYKRQHPEKLLPRNITDMPPPSELPPGFQLTPQSPTNPPNRPRPSSPPAGPDIYE